MGLGRVAEKHLIAIKETDGVELRAVVEQDGARRARWLRQHALPSSVNAHEDLEAPLANPDIGLVIVALPHALHAPMSIAALVAGKHVLVEKPMAVSLDECDAMIEAARASGRVLAVGHTMHFHATPLAVKGLIDSGRFGEVVWAEDVFYQTRRFGMHPDWMYEHGSGGGQLLANGVHLVDRALWTIGGPLGAAPAALVRARPVAVSATYGTIFNRAEPRYRADDACAMFIRFDTGQSASLLISGHAHRVQRSFTEYVCERGVVRHTDDELLVSVPEDPDASELRPLATPGTRGGFTPQLRDVVDAIRQQRSPAVPGEWGRAVLQVLLAAEASGRTGREVRLS